jgi:hypothetical protein
VPGQVDRDSEHMQLSVGPVDGPIRLVALLARASDGTFIVEDIADADVSDSDRQAVQDDLRFYLIEKREPDPWKYVQYHASTMSNVYSHVHWSWFPHGAEGGGAPGDPPRR